MPHAGTVEVKRLYVRPSYRGHGVARALMRYAHDHAAGNGFARVVLDVMPTRTRVIEFYRRLGYRESGPYPAESPDPMVYLERSVTRPWVVATGPGESSTGYGNDWAPNVSVGTGLLGILVASYRTGERLGRPSIGTDILLLECLRRLARSRPAAVVARRAVRERGGDPAIESTTAEVGGRGYPRSIELAANGAVREAAWSANRRSPDPAGPDPRCDRPVWTDAAIAVVCQALIDAHRLGVAHAGVAHLSVALLESGASRARELLDRCRIGPSQLLEQLDLTGGLRRDSRAWTPALDYLRTLGLVEGRAALMRFGTAIVRRGLRRHLLTSPVVYVFELEANRQTVRLGHPLVMPVHLLLAYLAMVDQLATCGMRIRPDVAPYNDSIRMARAADARYPDLLTVAADLAAGEHTPATFSPPTKRPGPRWTADAVATIERAGRIAARLGHQPLGIDHVLAAVLGSLTDDLASILELAAIDP